MIATVNLNFAVDIAPVFHVIPKGYDVSTSTAIFELRDKSGAELYAESSDGITVETITLTAPLKYPDSTEIIAGTEVAALRVAPDLSLLSLGDPEHVNPVQYRYGLRVDDAWTMQGWLTVWPDTGPAGCMGSPIAVCCGPQQIAVTVGSGPQGAQGVIGPAGPWETTSRLVTASGPILATDTLVIAQGGGADIELDCPETLAAELWDGVNGRVIVVSRKWADTGIATVTGPADGLPIELFSSPENGGESLWITTYDGINLVVGDAPFVVQVEASKGYLELDFVAADFVDGGIPLPVIIGNVITDSLVRDVLIRFDQYFDTQVSLEVGQPAEKYKIYNGDEGQDPEGYLTEVFRKLSGEINVYPDFISPPTVGSGTIFLTF